MSTLKVNGADYTDEKVPALSEVKCPECGSANCDIILDINPYPNNFMVDLYTECLDCYQRHYVVQWEDD